MILSLRYYNHPDLRSKAKPIEKITKEVLELAEDLIETMNFHKGVGLAAPQVGKLVRMFVRRDEIEQLDGTFGFGPPEVILNPEITKPSNETSIMLEGCLSLPGLHVEVERPVSIHLRYQTLKGEWIEEDLHDFYARVTMHENDHLNGVLHIDRTTASERKRVDKALKELKKKHKESLSKT